MSWSVAGGEVKFESLSIPDVKLVTPTVVGDERGFFMETWQRRKFAVEGIDVDFVQDNHSRSGKWVLRGLHYQVHQPQGKLLRVLRGCVFDVAVDLRRSSPTFGRWCAAELSEDNRRQLWVPPGFGHGFLVLSDVADIAYKCSDYYAPQHERSIRWDDETLAIEWPIPAGISPVISEKDRAGLVFDQAEVFP